MTQRNVRTFSSVELFILTLDDVEALSVMVFLQAQELSTIL